MQASNGTTPRFKLKIYLVKLLSFFKSIIWQNNLCEVDKRYFKYLKIQSRTEVMK